MGNVVKIRRKPRPLRATYDPTAPYVVTREDQDDGTISYYVTDHRPDSYRDVCVTNDDEGRDPFAKSDAEQIARGLNMLVQYGMEQLPKKRDRREEFDDLLADDLYPDRDE